MKKRKNTPTNVFKAFINAWLTEDIETVKNILSKNALQIVEKVSVAHEIPLNDALNFYEDKLLGHIFSGNLPIVRNENIDSNGQLACIEAKNFDTGDFDYFVFTKESGEWKLALDSDLLKVVRENTNIFEDLFDYLKNIIRNLLEKAKVKS